MARYSFNQDILTQRIYDLYVEMRQTRRYRSIIDISRELEITPMPVHYISFLQGRRVYYKHFIHHTPVKYKFISKNILYNSFIMRCRELKKQGITDHNSIISKALLSPAPCCGLSESQIRRILRTKGAR